MSKIGEQDLQRGCLLQIILTIYLDLLGTVLCLADMEIMKTNKNSSS